MAEVKLSELDAVTDVPDDALVYVVIEGVSYRTTKEKLVENLAKLDRGGYEGTAQDLADSIQALEDQEIPDVSDKLDKGGYEGTAQDIVNLIPLFEPGQNITIEEGVIDVDIPEILSSIILATTGSKPIGITIDSFGNIYIIKQGLNNVTKITPAGVSSILGTTGSKPTGITIDSAGNVYTANYDSNNVTKITPAGVSTVLGTTASNPYSITIDSIGNIYTANRGLYNVSKITPAGVSTIVGTIGGSPIGITVDSVGNIYITKQGLDNVTKITPAGVSSILGATGSDPAGITIDSVGNVYTANQSSSNVTKITPAGVSTVLGTTGSSPYGIVIDAVGNIYTANTSSNDVTKITPAGVSSIFGTTGSNPYLITVDSVGNIYTANESSKNITKITQDTARSLSVNDAGKIIRVPSPYTKSESDANDTAVIATLRDGVVAEGNTLQKLFNLISGAGAGVSINDLTPSLTETYSSQKSVDTFVAKEAGKSLVTDAEKSNWNAASIGSDLGLLKTTDTPPPTGTHKGDVATAGTYTNFKTAAAVSIVFTAPELVDNFGYIYVVNNVATKSLVAKKGGEVTTLQLNNGLDKKLDKTIGKNKWNPVKVTPDTYLASNGAPFATVNANLSEFIPITEGQSLISNNTSSGLFNALYDVNFALISGSAVAGNLALVGTAVSKYARFSMAKTVVLPQVEEGTVKTTPVKFTNNFYVDDKFESYVGNLFLEGYEFSPTLQEGRYILPTGVFVNAAGVYTSKFITVKNAKKIKLTNNSTGATGYTAIYNDLGNIVRVVRTDSNFFEIIFTEDEKYFVSSANTPTATTTLIVTVLEVKKDLVVNTVDPQANVRHISVTGSDTTGDGSFGNPFASMRRANLFLSNGGKLIIKNGIYWNLVIEYKEGITYQGESKDGVVIILGQKITTAVPEAGYTKVLKCTSPYTYNAIFVNMFQYGTADENTVITNTDRLAIHNGLLTRCPITSKIKKVTSLALIESSPTPAYFWDGTNLFFSIKTGTNLTDNPIFVPPAERSSINIDLAISKITLLGAGLLVQSKKTVLTDVNVGCVNASNLTSQGGILELNNVNSFQAQNDGSGCVNFGLVREYNSWFHDNDDEGSSSHEISVQDSDNSVYEYNASAGIVNVHTCSAKINNAYFQGNVGGSVQFTPISTGGFNFLNARLINCVMQEAVNTLPVVANVKYLNCTYGGA